MSVLWHKLLSPRLSHLSSESLLPLTGAPSLDSITVLDLCVARLSHLSSESLLPLTGAPSLDSITVLDLYGNGLAKLKGISSLMNLQRLYVSFNELTRLDDVAQMVRHVTRHGEGCSRCWCSGFDVVLRKDSISDWGV